MKLTLKFELGSGRNAFFQEKITWYWVPNGLLKLKIGLLWNQNSDNKEISFISNPQVLKIQSQEDWINIVSI